jgi:hypothetical protein
MSTLSQILENKSLYTTLLCHYRTNLKRWKMLAEEQKEEDSEKEETKTKELQK